MRTVTARVLCLLCATAAAACATASTSEEMPDARPAGADAGPRVDAGQGGGGTVASECPPGEFATGLDQAGVLECAPIGRAAAAAVNQHCSLYLGWRDDCDGCSSAPVFWGAGGGSACAVGVGGNNSCVTTPLGGVDVALFGLNTDGDVDDNDKFYLGWHCTPPVETPPAGPCPDGGFLATVDGALGTCVSARDLIVEYARTSCQLYAGWRDGCGGCTAAPSKWGRVSGEACENGAGAANTCTTQVLGDQTVRTFGLNTDGDVDDNDKFYLGFQCSGAAAADDLVDRSCPDGQLVVAIEEDGRVRCASPLPAAEAAIQSGCQLYLGWRDSCDGCQLPPTRWGRVGHADCAAGAGPGGTCAPTTLGGLTMPLYGLATGGDVDGNDKFYVGFSCQ